MRLGVIARSEARGLAQQSHEVCRNLDPERVLLVDPGPDKRFTQHPERYADWDTTTVRWTNGRLDENTVRPWLEGLDVVYTAETPYDERLPQWAAEAGCGVVVHANPEFLNSRDAKAPVTWWAATPWRLEHLPARTRVVPMPVPEAPYRTEPGDRVRFLHVAGWPAVSDRNGTGFVAEAAGHMRSDATVVIRGQHRDIDRYRRHTPRLTIESGCVPNHWDLYRDADVLVMPRRFGGLCLAEGSQVAMADGSRRPIESLTVGDVVLDDTGPTSITGTAHRQVDDFVSISLRGVRIESSIDHLHLVAVHPDGPLVETKAEHVRPGDWMLVTRPSADGITRVEVGPRPRRKGLTRWWEAVDLDEGWARLVGLWLAEGHGGLYPRAGRPLPIAELKWSFGRDEKWLADEVVSLLAERGLPATARRLYCETATFGPSETWTVRCRSLWLYELFQRLGLGHGAHGKRAPDLHAALVPSLVGGWLDGDGNEDRGSIAGFSRSTAMIRDLWRLTAKKGIYASITHAGQRLDITERTMAATVAGWTRRLRITRQYVKRPSSTRSRWRIHERGWLTKVTAVEHRHEPLNVVAIETTSGRYIAEDILTHNCLPALEALAVGLPVVMSDCPPNEVWPGPRVPTSSTGSVMTRCGPVQLHDVDPQYLAAQLDSLATNPDILAKARLEAAEWAAANTWDALKPMWLDELARACW